MWERLVHWIRGLFGMTKQEMQEFVDNPLVSDEMQNAYALWHSLFINQPLWLKEDFFCEASVDTKLPGIITSYVATLCAAEIKLSCGSGERAEWIQDQMDRFVMRDIRSAIQKAAGLSYVALKPYLEQRNVFCEVVSPMRFIPTRISSGTFLEGIFIDKKTVKDGNSETIYYRLEEHAFNGDNVLVTNKAYKTRIKKGEELPLSVVAEWADMKDKELVPSGGHPLFAVLKMPFANQVDPYSPLPVSLYANAVDSFEKLDRFYNDFIWEIESGRRKQIFDVTAVQQDKETTVGQTTNIRHFKTTDQYILLNMGDKGAPYGDYTPELRVEAYQSAMNVLVRLLEKQVMVSSETFGFDVKSGLSRAKTATEVLADDNETYNTVKSIQEDGLKQGLLDLIKVYDIYATLYNLAPAGAVSPAVEFGDSIFEDTGVEFLRRKSLADNGYYRPSLLTAWYFGVEEDEAKKMMPEQQPEEAGIFGAKAFGQGEDA